MNRNQWAVLALALLVAVVAPFVASSEPDGLEKAAEEVGAEEGWGISAPLPDYASSAGPAAQVGSLLLGSAAVFGILFLLGRLDKRGA